MISISTSEAVKWAAANEGQKLTEALRVKYLDSRTENVDQKKVCFVGLLRWSDS
jgi:hypothetical protein